MKKLLTLSLMFFSLTSFADVTCPKDADGKIVISSDVEDNDGCDFEAQAIKLDIYQIAVCKTAPVFSSTAAPDFSSCSFILNSPTAQTIELTPSNSSIDLQGVTAPDNGQYGYGFIATSNTLKVKATARIASATYVTDGSIFGSSGSVTGSGYSTSGSSQYSTTKFFYKTPHEFGEPPCDEGAPGCTPIDVVPGFADVVYAGTNSSLRLLTDNSTDRSRTYFIFKMYSPITVSDLMDFNIGINLTSAASLVLDGSNNVTQLRDGPIGLRFIVNNPKPF